MPEKPIKRQDELDVCELPNNEILVYDRRHRATHYLAPETALVWQKCDGRNDRLDLGKILSAHFNLPHPTLVAGEAIERLDRLNLIRFRRR